MDHPWGQLVDKHNIRLAFVGSGNWARKYHFPSLAYLTQRSISNTTRDLSVDLRLRGIYSLDSEIAVGVASETGFELVYPSLDALLDDDAVDAIAVAVTPSALASVLKRVIKKGVPIISEKPPGVTTQEAKDLSDLITVPNVLAFNRRFAPSTTPSRALSRIWQTSTMSREPSTDTSEWTKHS